MESRIMSSSFSNSTLPSPASRNHSINLSPRSPRAIANNLPRLSVDDRNRLSPRFSIDQSNDQSNNQSNDQPVEQQQLRSVHEEGSNLKALRAKHDSILNTIGAIQDKTARILTEQERDLVRAFRARLADVAAELDRERARNESGSTEWVNRCKKLTEEVEFLKDAVDRLNNENKALIKANKKLNKQLTVQNQDREFLIKQLVQAKQEIQRLKEGHFLGHSNNQQTNNQSNNQSNNHINTLQSTLKASRGYSAQHEEQKERMFP